MPYNGSGTFNRVYSWASDALGAIPITASRTDTEDTGFATGLTNCICKDGQSATTAKIPFAVGIGLSDGTVGAPSLSFNSDATTGLYRIGLSNVGVTLAGAKALDISTSGLTITGKAVLTAVASNPQFVGNANWGHFGDLTGGIPYVASNAYYDNTGTPGYRYGSTHASLGYGILNVQNNGVFWAGASGATTINAAFTPAAQSKLWSQADFNYTPANKAGDTFAGAVTITSGGLTLTSGNLAVSSGTISASSTISTSGKVTASAAANLFGSAAGSVSAPSVSNTNLLLYNQSATNWAGIGSDTNGHVYIRTGAAADHVTVHDNLGNLYPQTDNSASCGITGNRWLAVWAVNGAIQTSDERIKDNFAAFDALATADKIDVVAFDLHNGKVEGGAVVKGDVQHRTIGVKAQQVRAAFPGLGGIVEGDESKEILGLVESKMGVLALAAVKELAAKIKELEAAIQPVR